MVDQQVPLFLDFFWWNRTSEFLVPWKGEWLMNSCQCFSDLAAIAPLKNKLPFFAEICPMDWALSFQARGNRSVQAIFLAAGVGIFYLLHRIKAINEKIGRNWCGFDGSKQCLKDMVRKMERFSEMNDWWVVSIFVLFIFHHISYIYIYGMSSWMSSFPLTKSIIFQDGHIAPPDDMRFA